METDILEETATAVKQEDESKNIVSVDDKARIAIDDEENGEVDISYNLETSNKESKEIYDHFQHDEFYEYEMRQHSLSPYSMTYLKLSVSGMRGKHYHALTNHLTSLMSRNVNIP